MRVGTRLVQGADLVCAFFNPGQGNENAKINLGVYRLLFIYCEFVTFNFLYPVFILIKKRNCVKHKNFNICPIRSKKL